MPTEKQLNYWNSMKGGNRSGFRKGHPFYKGGERGWFKKGQKAHNLKGVSIEYRRKHPPTPKPSNCESCGSDAKDTKKGICFDHDHDTNKFRGWLCQRCNIALGMLKNDYDNIIKLAEYIKKNK